MAEYIDRKKIRYHFEVGEDTAIEGRSVAYKTMIDSMPTEDVQEVKCGEWKAEGDCGITRCSVCGWTIEECIEDNYCRNCGAKMDGDANGNL